MGSLQLETQDRFSPHLDVQAIQAGRRLQGYQQLRSHLDSLGLQIGESLVVLAVAARFQGDPWHQEVLKGREEGNE